MRKNSITDVWLCSKYASGYLSKLLYKLLCKSSLPEVFCREGVLRNLAKLTGKHLCQSLFFDKVAGLFLWILRNFDEHLYIFLCSKTKQTLHFLLLGFFYFILVFWIKMNDFSKRFPFCFCSKKKPVAKWVTKIHTLKSTDVWKMWFIKQREMNDCF